MKYIICFMASVLLVGACSYEEDPALPNDSALKAYIEPKEKPNHYEVRLHWEIPKTGPSWVVHRQDDEASPRLLSTLEAKESSFTDSQVTSGKKYRYLLGALSGNSYATVAEVGVAVPRDMEIKERLVISQITGIGRLFLSASSHLVTEGKDAIISVDEIISDNGVVESFSEGARAPFGQTGRNGGLIHIKAKRGKGNLLVHARGEGGGIGVPGASGTNGKKGKTGRFAISTHERVDVVCNCGHRARELREQIKQGNIFAHFQFMTERMRHRCISEPADGTQGEPGTAGTHGSHGGPGGNSAKVYVEIEDVSQIQVNVFLLPGAGGAGGLAGTGGKGGPGGDPGDKDLDFFSVCRNPAPGPMGLAGIDGKQGLPGQSGSEEPICLRLGGQKSPDCNKF